MYGTWVVGRPIAVCAISGAAESAGARVSVELPPVTLPPLRATWGNGYLMAGCFLQDDPRYYVGADSREEAQDLADDALTCAGAGERARIAECWGPVGSADEARFYCRLQNLHADYAFVEGIPLKSE